MIGWAGQSVLNGSAIVPVSVCVHVNWTIPVSVFVWTFHLYWISNLYVCVVRNLSFDVSYDQ